MTIRVNNPTAGLALAKLGMKPTVMQIQQISSAISSGTIEGAAVPLSMLFEFGIGRVATHHYFLLTSSAPLALLMSRKKFESLPPKAQDVIRKFSGEWSAERFIEVRARIESDVMKQLKSDARRNFVLPSAADMERRADGIQGRDRGSRRRGPPQSRGSHPRQGRDRKTTNCRIVQTGDLSETAPDDPAALRKTG